MCEEVWWAVEPGPAAGLSTWDAWLYPLVFQGISEPISIIATVTQQPFCRWQTAEPCHSTGVIADLTCGHKEPDRAAISIGDGVQLGVHPTLCSAYETASLVVRPPFFTRRLIAVRCAFR